MNWAAFDRALAEVRPFAWGERDCCLFCADLVLALTGVDYAARLRGAYHTRREAVLLLRAHGGMEAMVTALLGPARPGAFARRGDLVLAPADGVGANAIGVNIGVSHVMAGHHGVVTRPRNEARACWGVECQSR